MNKDWKELRKTIFGIIGSNEYLQPDMVIDHKGLMWRFNQDWLNKVTNDIMEVLKSKLDIKLDLCKACNHYTDDPLKHLAKCKKLQNLITIEKTIEELRSTK